MTIRELFTRDIGRKIANEGVAKVWDEDVLVRELKDYVVTEEIATHLAQVLDAFLDSMDMRKRGSAREGMSVWVSGFFGSGKSHFAKILGHLLANTELDPEAGRTTLDVLEPHVEHTSKARELRSYFHRLETQVSVHPVMLDMKREEDLIRPESVAEICMAGFYESLGFSRTLYVARIEEMLTERGVFDEFRDFYEAEFEEVWEVGRRRELFNRTRIAKALAHCLPDEFDEIEDAENAIEDARERETINAESFANTLLDHLDRMAEEDGKKEPHIVFVLDEMQQFIGDDGQKIEELRTLVESLGARGHGRVWVICCGQEALDKVVDRAGVNLAALGKLGARFSHRVNLRSEHVTKVIEDLILRKKEQVRPELAELYNSHDGFLAACCDLDLERHIAQTQLDEAAFVDNYPLLPYQMVLAHNIFDTMRGTKLSGNERSMLAVTQPILKQLADESLGALVPFDWIFDEIENELCSDDHLGTHGVNSIKGADDEVVDWDIEPSRCLKVLWLIQRLEWVSRSAENISRLLVDSVDVDLTQHADEVEKTLNLLQKAGHVALDEGSNQYKFLSAEEGEVEKALLTKQSGLGLGEIVRRSREIIKDQVLTTAKLNSFSVKHGASRAVIDFALVIDNEEISTSGEITLEAYSPLSSFDGEKIKKQCIAAGPKDTTISWLAEGNSDLEDRLKRLVALEWLISDPNHKSNRSEKYIKAVEDKRQEAEELLQSVADDLEKCFKQGTMCYAGETVELDAGGQLMAPVQDAMDEVIRNVYTRFGPADVEYDVDNIDKLLDPSEKNLQEASGDLNLFDGAGALMRSAPLVEPVLEELGRREDASEDTTGKAIADHFGAIPFGWPEDLLRLVIAALVRGGAMAVVTSGQKHYDYSESAVQKALTGVREFRRAQFSPIKGGLSHEEIVRAKELLIELGVTGVAESANAQAKAVRQWAQDYRTSADSAQTLADTGLPLPDTYRMVETTCQPLVDENDPTKVVRGLLDAEDKWRDLHEFFEALDEFRDQNRVQMHQRFQRLIDRCENNGALRRSEQSAAAEQALSELNAMEDAKTVVSKWLTYRENAEKLQEAYRKAYRAQHQEAAKGAEDLRGRVTEMPEWEKLETDRRKAIEAEYFEDGARLHILDAPDLTDLGRLLDITSKQSLESLESTVMALSSLEKEIVAAVRQAFQDQQEAEGGEIQKSFVWDPTEELKGQRFESKDDLSESLNSVRQKLEDKLDDDYIIIVE